MHMLFSFKSRRFDKRKRDAKQRSTVANHSFNTYSPGLSSINEQHNCLFKRFHWESNQTIIWSFDPRANFRDQNNRFSRNPHRPAQGDRVGLNCFSSPGISNLRRMPGRKTISSPGSTGYKEYRKLNHRDAADAKVPGGAKFRYQRGWRCFSELLWDRKSVV